MENPFYLKQEWPNWQPLSLDSVPWCLIAAQFHTQAVRPQKVVEYSVAERPKPNKSPASESPADSTKNKQDFPRGSNWSWASKEAATRALQESLLEAQLKLERELAPSRMLVPEISITYTPEWKPLALPSSYSATRQQKTKEDGEASSPSAFTFLILAHPHQVPTFCEQSASGLVCLRSFSIPHPGPYPYLHPLDAGILTLIRPLIQISGLLPLTGPPLFPLKLDGPVAKLLNEAFEVSRLRCPSGVLWSLVDTQPQHPIATGL